MDYRTLGPSGLRVSVIGLGCNNFGMRTDLDGTRAVIHHALDLGITLFDTADIYGNRGGSEDFMGQVLGDRRKDIVLATKFGKPMDDHDWRARGSRDYIVRAVEASLRRLRTDWIDLYQMHEEDPATPIEETLRALDDLVRSGKVRYIGCSNFSAWRVVEADWVAETGGTERFICCQDEYSLLMRGHEQALIPAIREYGLGLLPYFPLAGGLLTGKYARNAPLPEGARLTASQARGGRFLNEANLEIVENLRSFAEARGRSLLELAFSWLLAQDPVASVIAGATRPDQLDANIAAAGWELSEEELEEIDRITGD